MPAFQLPLARYDFRFRASTPVTFPAYAGSTWRGALGHALKQTVCITREPTCDGCLLWRSCVYSQVFATPAGQEPLLGKVDAAPHPYLLHPLATSGKYYAPGESFGLRLTLLGAAIAHLPYLVHSLQKVGERGVGKGDGLFHLVAVQQESGVGTGNWQTIHTPGASLQALPGQVPTIPPVPTEAVRVTFHTPFRLLQDGKLVHVGRFSFQLFINNLMRRISLLHVYHAGVTLAVDFKALSLQALSVPVLEADLHWHEWSRYSSRQHIKVQMGGLVGSFALPAAALADFWPWLWLGQWVQAGKGTVMGMGEYSLTYQN